MPIQLFVATTNAGKLRDFRVAADAYSGEFRIEPLPGLNSIPAAPEDGATFAENACSKAMYYSNRAEGCVVLADDSGLEVDALQGAPGVRSARYASDAGFRVDLAADAANNLFLLENLRSVPDRDRTARYRCVLATASNGEILTCAEGTVEGMMLHEPRGSGGFGYDPLFYLPSRGCTMAELDLESKHTISHRGQALRALLLKMR
ncbi:MAG TPA: non-canonical purine NTP pyrophosphatase [Acidobacteriaceae bacterium]|jgi:XTP/dITP diphosphohydrolase|nr:non-canonical purine NTP pyrophosphatase [Acidobacteriaceae bacterium]